MRKIIFLLIASLGFVSLANTQQLDKSIVGFETPKKNGVSIVNLSGQDLNIKITRNDTLVLNELVQPSKNGQKLLLGGVDLTFGTINVSVDGTQSGRTINFFDNQKHSGNFVTNGSFCINPTTKYDIYF